MAVHLSLARAGILISAIIGVWGLWTYFSRGVASPGYRSTLVLTEILFVAQALLGMALFLGSRHPRDNLHILYGVVLVLAIPIAASYTSSHDRRREALVYGVIGIIMVGLSVRAFMTS